MNDQQDKQDALQRKRDLLILRRDLPHLYGHKRYTWQNEFLISLNLLNFLCAGNQVGKSAILIIKCITWATDRSLWQKLWGRPPKQFWYFYPDMSTATREFEEKWIPFYLPKGQFKDDEEYGWTEVYEKKEIQKIEFRSGLTVYFFSYATLPTFMQASTIDAVFADEECPEKHYNELIPRLAHGGYYHNAFTPTLGQEYLRLIIEAKGKTEKLPHAFKRQISLWDCVTYADGTPSKIWNKAKIENYAGMLSSKAEVEKRVNGRFIKSEGLLYPTFSRSIHVVPPFKIPEDWLIWSGTDSGSGGESNHPAANIFVAVNPTYTLGYIFKCWRGDGIVTTAPDIVSQHKKMAHGLRLIQAKYDYAGSGTDIGIIGRGASMPFTKANKDRATGIKILNSLWKRGMLYILASEEDAEEWKLVGEMETVTDKAKELKQKDDLSDALRYAVVDIPWNWELSEQQRSRVNKFNSEARALAQWKEKGRRVRRGDDDDDEMDPIEEELAEVQAMLGGGWDDYN